MIWLSWVVGGYFYVMYYAADKALIQTGPWPFAHGLAMETSEHVFLMLLVLATFLPIAAAGQVVASRSLRSAVLWTSALVVLMGLAMEGAGAMVSMGAKVALTSILV